MSGINNKVYWMNLDEEAESYRKNLEGNFEELKMLVEDLVNGPVSYSQMGYILPFLCHREYI